MYDPCRHSSGRKETRPNGSCCLMIFRKCRRCIFRTQPDSVWWIGTEKPPITSKNAVKTVAENRAESNRSLPVLLLFISP